MWSPRDCSQARGCASKKLHLGAVNTKSKGLVMLCLSARVVLLTRSLSHTTTMLRDQFSNSYIGDHLALTSCELDHCETRYTWRANKISTTPGLLHASNLIITLKICICSAVIVTWSVSRVSSRRIPLSVSSCDYATKRRSIIGALNNVRGLAQLPKSTGQRSYALEAWLGQI